MEESDIISTGVGWKNDTRRFQNESHERENYWNICKECEYKFKGIIRL